MLTVEVTLKVSAGAKRGKKSKGDRDFEESAEPEQSALAYELIDMELTVMADQGLMKFVIVKVISVASGRTMSENTNWIEFRSSDSFP